MWRAKREGSENNAKTIGGDDSEIGRRGESGGAMCEYLENDDRSVARKKEDRHTREMDTYSPGTKRNQRRGKQEKWVSMPLCGM